MPQTSPLAWQTSLIDSEVDSILSGLTDGRKSVTAPKRRDFLRRGSGRTSAAGNGSADTGDGNGLSENEAGREGETQRLELVPGEVWSLDVKAFVNISRLLHPNIPSDSFFFFLNFETPVQMRIVERKPRL